MIPYDFYYFGPLLVKMKVTKEDLNKVKKILSKKGYHMKKDLAGVIEGEYELVREDYDSIMRPYIDVYKDAYVQFKGGTTLDQHIHTKRAWVNYMKPGEYNPPHIHSNCDLSSVLFISIPEKLKKENKKWHDSKSGGPGSISFNTAFTGNFYNAGVEQFPEEGDFWMFPYSLIHFVAPFKSKCERISVAANFDVR
mgnify:FL=1|jgi:uncharacterized protein (TIGR02466 family)|tara:strand:+ start:96 stop:680 length:585 start_codon:yes stop_codon:yes gene_type:complete